MQTNQILKNLEDKTIDQLTKILHDLKKQGLSDSVQEEIEIVNNALNQKLHEKNKKQKQQHKFGDDHEK